MIAYSMFIYQISSVLSRYNKHHNNQKTKKKNIISTEVETKQKESISLKFIYYYVRFKNLNQFCRTTMIFCL